MKKIIIFILPIIIFCLQALANPPVKKTPRGICYPPEHPRYEKVKDYINTYQSLQDCLKSGGITIERTTQIRKLIILVVSGILFLII